MDSVGAVESSCCRCSNIAIMQLFHELKQKFPAVPDRVVSQCIKKNSHNKETCEVILSHENQTYLLHSYPTVLKMAGEPQINPLSLHGLSLGHCDQECTHCSQQTCESIASSHATECERVSDSLERNSANPQTLPDMTLRDGRPSSDLTGQALTRSLPQFSQVPLQHQFLNLGNIKSIQDLDSLAHIPHYSEDNLNLFRQEGGRIPHSFIFQPDSSVNPQLFQLMKSSLIESHTNSSNDMFSTSDNNSSDLASQGSVTHRVSQENTTISEAPCRSSVSLVSSTSSAVYHKHSNRPSSLNLRPNVLHQCEPHSAPVVSSHFDPFARASPTLRALSEFNTPTVPGPKDIASQVSSTVHGYNPLGNNLLDRRESSSLSQSKDILVDNIQVNVSCSLQRSPGGSTANVGSKTSTAPEVQKIKSTIQVHPAPHYSSHDYWNKEKSKVVNPAFYIQQPRSSTSVNLTLRPPSSEPQPPIDIHSAGTSLTYSTSSYDPQQGFQSQLQIRIGPGRSGSVSAVRTRSSDNMAPLYCTSPPISTPAPLSHLSEESSEEDSTTSQDEPISVQVAALGGEQLQANTQGKLSNPSDAKVVALFQILSRFEQCDKLDAREWFESDGNDPGYQHLNDDEIVHQVIEDNDNGSNVGERDDDEKMDAEEAAGSSHSDAYEAFQTAMN
uniref:Uncharacterized protein n=1 Tax=Timema cristinae TaxID=61476 RepID=A0A7R9CNP6_TIMCR|nr:unnamed protein product [Timema cristinae]